MIGIGQIGAGWMARTRAEAFLRQGGVRYVACWARSGAGREAFGHLTGARAAEDWREVIENPKVEAVCVAVPTSLHAGFASAAIHAGKHVLVECPAAGSLADFDLMLDAARRSDAARGSGVTFYPGSNYRFNPQAQAIEFGATRIGRVLLAHGDSCWNAEGSWYRDPALSGGLFTCVHLYQFTLFHCLGPAAWVEASSVPGAYFGVATVGYRSGAIGVATGGFMSQMHSDIGLVGSDGAVRTQADGRLVIERPGGVEAIPVAQGDHTESDNAAFLSCVRGETDWQIHAQREREIHALCFAAEESARREGRVNL